MFNRENCIKLSSLLVEKRKEYDQRILYNTVIDVKPIINKIFNIINCKISKINNLEIYPLKDIKFIKENDPNRIIYDLKAHHIKFLMAEGFHIMYSPTDSCYLVTW